MKTPPHRTAACNAAAAVQQNTGREFALRNVRIWFKKDFECRYISHLDLNRTMLRALHKSKLPIWHTEGFNPHPFATFPLPLSLGFRGVNECMDVKLEDDNFLLSDIPDRLNACLPRGIRVFDATEAVMKAGKVAYASFTLLIGNPTIATGKIATQLRELLDSEKIEIEKKSKKGMKIIDIKQGVKQFEMKEHFDAVQLDIILTAGSSDNVNPNLLITALERRTGDEYVVDITRNDLYNSELELFR